MNVFKAIVLVIVMIFISSCNQERSRSSAYTNKNNNGLTSLGSTNYSSGVNDVSRNPAGNGDTGTPRADDTASLPAEVAHCKFVLDTKGPLEIATSVLGELTICKSKTDDRIIYVQFAKEQTTRLLMIPTYNSGTKSFYVGSPVYNINESTLTAYKIYKYELQKNRKGFENYPITSVMLMKDQSNFYPYPYNSYKYNSDAYLVCNNWLYQTKDPVYCNAFKSVGQYVYKVF